MKVRFKVRDDLAFWGCSAGKFAAGEEHELDTDETTIREIIAGEAAGSIYDLVDVDGAVTASMLEVVERQDISEGQLEKAMADGRWQEGHLQQFTLDSEYAEIEIGAES